MSRTKRKPWLLPKPESLPDGYMLFYRRVVPIETAEAHAARIMRGFDSLPSATRFALNAVPVWPEKAGIEVARRGDSEAAQSILRSHWPHVFKTRDGTGVHP
jgi:hypothetical protein